MAAFEDLRQRIDRTLKELGLVEALDAVGIKRSMVLNALSRPTSLQRGRRRGSTRQSFLAAALDRVHDPPEAVAQRIRGSDIRGPLIASLDDWARCESNEDGAIGCSKSCDKPIRIHRAGAI